MGAETGRAPADAGRHTSAIGAWLRYLPVQVALFAVAYFALARAGLLFAIPPEAITSIWPASGLYVGVLLVTARRRWPAFVAAALVADLAANLAAGNGLTSFGITGVTLCEGLLAASLTLWVGGSPFTLGRIRQIVALALAGAGVANALTALLAAAVLSLSFGDPFWQSWVVWWTADGIGMLAVAPVICAALAAPLTVVRRRQLVETLLLLGGLAFCSFLAFAPDPGALGAATVLPPALGLPFLFWLAWRSGPLGAACGSLLLCAMAALFTVEGRGPFAAANLSQDEQLLSLQLFLGVSVGTALALASAVTERRAASEELMRERGLLKELLTQNESILSAAGEGIYGIDADGMVTLANPAAVRMTGHELGELDGRYLHAEIHHSRPDGTPYPSDECPMLASLADAAVHRCDSDVYWRKDGTCFPVEFTSTPLVSDGQVEGAVVVFRDISERRAVERAKDEFTSVVSHELRTPLTSIRGSLGLLESGALGPLPEKGQRMVEIAVENTDRLVRLINDILDIERIDSGTIDMQPELCDAGELIERAIEGLGQFAAEAGVDVVADDEKAALFVDPDRVLQTLTNLISNAVKFSPGGTAVRVSSACREGEVLFQVADEGRGIPPDKLEAVFERFQQVDASDSREKGGTGLGLAICRTIVERHGGRIWAESRPGAGSTFSFTLPAQRVNGHADGERTGSGPAILVCDDDPSVVEVVGAVLAQRGYRVIEAHSGEQAVERAVSERPDAILLDLLMAGMSGWETAAALKEDPRTGHIPIVILSVLSEAETRAPDGPVAAWVEKPLDERALFAALERAVKPRSEPFKVLVVEDDADLAAVLTATFERHGIDTFHAADGHVAIQLSQQVRPDLLVLDIGLAEADGFEVVDWLRRHDRLNALPIVVYTARELDDDDRARLRLGDATEFLTKGRITPQDFEHRVMQLLGRITRSRPEVGDEVGSQT